MYVDVHCHLDDKAYNGDIEPIIAKAKTAGLKAIISNGINRESNEAVKAICERFPLVRPAYGFYPTDEANNDAEVIQWIRDEARGILPPVAIGEIGLDAVNPITEKQLTRFRAFCNLANELHLPVLIHSRKAEQQVYDELALLKLQVPIIMHCFGGSKKLVEEGTKRGYYFSIPANITRLDHFKMMVELLPLTQLLTETDAPYLSPDKNVFPNDSSSVVGTVAIISQIKKITIEECTQALFMNYQRVFS